jgi:hypothetical protein
MGRERRSAEPPLRRRKLTMPPSTGITITFNAETEEALSQVRDFFASTQEGLDRISGASEFLGELGEKIAAAFTVGALVEFTREAINAADEMGHLHEQTGISIETLNALKKIAEGTRLSFEELTTGLNLFNNRIGEALQLGGQARRPFDDLKVSLLDVNGQVKGTEQLLREVSSALRALPAGPEKTFDVKQLFGRGASDFIPFLDQLIESLDRVKREGSPITPEMAENARQFNQGLTEMKTHLEEVFQQVASNLLPTLNQFNASLKQNETEMAKEDSIATHLTDIIRFVATACEAAYSGTMILLDGVVALSETIIEVGSGAVEHLWNSLLQLVESLKSLGFALTDTVRMLKDLGPALDDVAHGHFRKAANEFRIGADAVKEDFRSFTGHVASSWHELELVVTKGLDNFNQISDVLTGMINDEADRYTAAFNAIWGIKTPGIVEPNKRPAAAGPVAPDWQGPPPPVTDAGKKMLEEIDKQWEEVTKSKIALLYAEQAEAEKVLNEIQDPELANQTSARIKDIYFAKRKELIEKQNDARGAIAFSQAEGQRKEIEGNPLLTDADKAEKLIPVLELELQLIQQQIQVNRQRVSDPSSSTEAKLAGEKELVRLEQQRVELGRQIQQLNSAGFTAGMQQGLVKLQSQWQDLGGNLAGTVLSGIQTAVHGVTDSIMGAIEGTKTWGQVFLQVGRQIISSIIEVVLQWITQMTILAALKRLFGVEDETQAATTAAAWAPAAIAASIASFGSAAATGATAFATAMISGTALATGLSGFEAGGVVGGGRQIIMVNESGTEAVLNARALRNAGAGFVDDLNAGHSPAYAAMRASGGGAGSARPGGGGAGGGVTVHGHQVSVMMVDSRNQAREYLNSAQGQKHVVDIARRRRVDIGVNT